jgi:hypothetical protein
MSIKGTSIKAPIAICMSIKAPIARPVDDCKVRVGFSLNNL